MPRNLNTRKRIYRKDAKVQSGKATTGSIPKGLRHSAKRCHAEGKATLGDESQIEINLERVVSGARSSRPQPPLAVGAEDIFGIQSTRELVPPNLGLCVRIPLGFSNAFLAGRAVVCRPFVGRPTSARPT